MHTDWKKSRVKLNESRCLSLNCAKASNVSVSHTLRSFPAAVSPNLGSSTGTCSAGGRQGRITLPTYHTPAHQGCSVWESLAEPTWQRISEAAVDLWERESTFSMEPYLGAYMSWWSEGSKIPTVHQLQRRKAARRGQSLWVIPIHKRENMGTSQGSCETRHPASPTTGPV